MQHKPIQHALKSHFNIDPRRLEFIARFIIALLKAQTVNLNKISAFLNGKVELESNSKRARRFLDFDLPQALIAQFVLTFIKDEKLVLCMDRTNWKYGSLTINFLVIAIAYLTTGQKSRGGVLNEEIAPSKSSSFLPQPSTCNP